MIKLYVVFILGSLFMLSCSKDDNANLVAYDPTAYDLQVPLNFPELKYNTGNNPLTKQGVELGRRLFYDGKLSANNAVPCAFCHEQAFAFTHHGHNLSHGINGGIGFRNSQPMQNLGFQNSFMWDGASDILDLQPIIPITSEIEMGENLTNVISKLKADLYYQNQFVRAFEDGEINTANMLKALSQFMVSMISANSKYDKYIRNEDNVKLSSIEKDGLATFKSKCASCHATDLFTDQSFRNTGLPVNPRLNDKGRYLVFENPDDLYKFKVPSLRNVEVTFPYMHDGRIRTLEAVLDFYDNGMVENGGIVDASLKRDDGSLGITLNAYEKESLVAFLKTLTDEDFLTDERFSEF